MYYIVFIIHFIHHIFFHQLFTFRSHLQLQIPHPHPASVHFLSSCTMDQHPKGTLLEFVSEFLFMGLKYVDLVPHESRFEMLKQAQFLLTKLYRFNARTKWGKPGQYDVNSSILVIIL